MFLDCKVFNTSVDKFVEINAGVSANFRQFNILARIALLVCNTDDSYPVETTAERGWLAYKSSKLELGPAEE